MTLNNDIYGRVVTLNSDGVTDTYTVTDSSGNFFNVGFPTGTSLSQVYASIDSMAPNINPVLAIAIAQNIQNFEIALSSFVASRYSIETRQNFFAIYINAQQNNLTNRENYVSQLFPWMNAVVNYSISYISSVQAMTDPNQVAANVWNFASLIASDPCISLAAALNIGN